MRPETALIVKKVIEQYFNNVCVSFNVPADREAYYNQLLDHIREVLPRQDAEFYFNICLDFWENIIESAKILDQSEPWGDSPYGEMEALVKLRSSGEAEAPGAAEIIGPLQPQKKELKDLLDTRAVLEQIAALGDCLMAIAGEKELQSRKRTFVSLGVLIHQVVEIIRDLLKEPK